MNQEILKEIRRSGFSFRQLSVRYPELCAMKDIPQDPAYHGEGTYTATRKWYVKSC